VITATQTLNGMTSVISAPATISIECPGGPGHLLHCFSPNSGIRAAFAQKDSIKSVRSTNPKVYFF
jgi:hypothetical protein